MSDSGHSSSVEPSFAVDALGRNPDLYRVREDYLTALYLICWIFTTFVR